MDAGLSALLPDDVVVEEVDLSTVQGDGRSLYPEEWTTVERAVLKRRREFEGGRVAARRAMLRLGVEAAAVVPGPRRAPVWPAGIVGSITHTRDRCVAALARAGDYRGVGIDLEPAEPVREALFRMICTAEELATLELRSAEERGDWARALFSAKEAAYKAQFCLTTTFLPFSAMTIAFDPDGGFRARFNVDVAPYFAIGDVLGGRYARGARWVATAVVLPNA